MTASHRCIADGRRRSFQQFGDDCGRLIEILSQFGFAFVAEHLRRQIPGFLFGRCFDLTQIAGSDADVVDRHVPYSKAAGLAVRFPIAGFYQPRRRRGGRCRGAGRLVASDGSAKTWPFAAFRDLVER